VNGTLYLSSNPYGFYNLTNPSPVINTSYYLSSNPFSFYNVTTAPIYINDTFAGNYSDFLTHISWNDAVNGTLYLSSNPYGFYNSTNPQTETDPLAYNGTLMFVSDWNATNLSYVPYTGASSNLDLGNNNLSVGTSDLFVNSNTGNVGIGTTSPGAKLDVVGSTWPVVDFTRSVTGSDLFYGVWTMGAKTTADMVDGFGANTAIVIEDSAGVENVIGSFGAIRDGADNSGRMEFRVRNAGSEQ